MDETPKACDKCHADLDGKATVQKFVNDKVVRTVCVDCDQAERHAKFKETGVLSTWLVEAEVIKDAWRNVGDRPSGPPADAAVMEAYKSIEAAIKTFEQEVWFAGLQEFARKAKTKGTGAEAEGVKLMCYTMCGRAMITVEDENATVTVITLEDELPPKTPMGFRGIHATKDQALGLFTRVGELWKAKKLALKEDRNVSMGF